jgi:hypothetical protein
VFVSGRRCKFAFQFASEPKPQFGGGGLSESYDKQFVQRHSFALQAIQAAGDQRFGLAGAGPGHDKYVAARKNGSGLRSRQ